MRVLGVCAGNGVMIHPLKKYLIANIEPRGIFHTPKDLQWICNFNAVPIGKDLKIIKNLAVPIDVIIGHPDCGHSSILSYSRKKSFGEPKENKSLTLFIDSVNKYKPKVFIMENLPALVNTFGKKSLKRAFKDYNLRFINEPVTKFGNSQQTRVRLLLIGVLKIVPKKLTKCFKVLNYENYHLKDTKTLLAGLKTEDFSLNHARESLDSVITIYAGKKMSLKEIQNHWLKGPKDETRFRVTDRKFTTAPGVYRNLENRAPFTVRKGNREFNPQGLMMSARERARIQGIPDSFELYFEEERAQYWINKGRVTATKTPPYEIGVWILKSLKKFNKKAKLW